MMEWFAIPLVVLGTVFGGFASLCLKRSSKAFNLNILEQLKNYNLMGGAFLYVIASLVFIVALKFGELSILYPITSLSYVWVSLLSIKHLGEKMNKFKWAGITLILLGAFLVTW